jgi:L-ribulose-5-phosphate 4-epimerase
MEYGDLRTTVCRANLDLGRSGLVVLAFGNASAVDRAAGVMAIKPSGAVYEALTPEDIVVIALTSGAPLAGATRPSSDTLTHLELYRSFGGIGGIVHTHSPYATSWAQARREIPCLGTTHADHFRGPTPVSRELTQEEIAGAYEANTGRVIVECFAAGLDPGQVPGVLVASHGPFVWGETVEEALANSVALEHIAAIATHQLAHGTLVGASGPLQDRHFRRKHGPTAYYGRHSASGAAHREDLARSG